MIFLATLGIILFLICFLGMETITTGIILILSILLIANIYVIIHSFRKGYIQETKNGIGTFILLLIILIWIISKIAS